MAQQIVDAGDDYVVVVKENQPQLLEDIQTVFAHARLAGEIRMEATTGDSDHGHIAQRRLQMSRVLAGYSDWLGLAQVFQMEAR
jgi:hypothetical protein